MKPNFEMPVSPEWVNQMKEAIASVGQGWEKLRHGPATFHLDKLAGAYCYLLARYSPYQIGQRVALTETPQIDEDHNPGWIGLKHFLVAGAKGRVVEIDCDHAGFIFNIVFDVETYLWEGAARPVALKHKYSFRERWLCMADDIKTAGATIQNDDPPIPSTACSTDGEMAAMLVRWKDRILHRAALNIDNHMIDGPVEDFTNEERGFERGLRTAVDEVCKLMADPGYWSPNLQNEKGQL